MTNARELAAMKARIWPALTPAEVREINWAAIAAAAAAAFDRGWTGFEVGSAAIENLGNARNLGALVVANIRNLAQVDPPREHTPTPPPAELLTRPECPPAADPHHWAELVRAETGH